MSTDTVTLNITPVGLKDAVVLQAAQVITFAEADEQGNREHDPVKLVLDRYFPYDPAHAHHLTIVVRLIYNFVTRMLNEPDFVQLETEERRIIADALQAYKAMENRFIASVDATLVWMMRHGLENRTEWTEWNERFLAQAGD